MKTIVRSFCLITLLAATVLPGWSQTEVITILHLNDTHSNLAPIGPRDAELEGTLGGIARAATLAGLTRMTDANVLFLHAGDVCVGDMFYNVYFGVPELQILLALGCDAMTVGNHEFDLTPATLLEALDSSFVEGSFPLLSANLNLDAPEVQPLKSYIQPYTVKQFGSVKVGIFGLTTPATNTLSMPSPAYVDSDFVSIGAAMVDTLKALGCDAVICLSHLGFMYDTWLAQSVPGINVIIGGHDHYTFSSPQTVESPGGDTTYIVQADAFYLDMGKMKLEVGGGHVSLLSYELMSIDENVPTEPSIDSIVTTLVAGIEQVYGPMYTQQVATVTADFAEVAEALQSHGRHDTPIGDLVTDAFRATTGTDVAMEVGGSTAEPLYHGPIVCADLFRVVGYGFNMVNGLGYQLAIFHMSGEALFAGLEFGVSDIEENDEFLVQVSGMKYLYDPDSIPRIREVWINGAPLDPEATYSVTGNEFVPMFLDFLGIPYSNLHICQDTTEFQVLLGYATQVQTLTPITEGRVCCVVWDTTVTSVGGGKEALPSQFVLHQNYPNPFNPSTHISFELASPSEVRLAVYDLLGREVTVLKEGEMRAGSHQLTWDARGRESGVYFIRLQAGPVTQTKKMILMK